MSRYSTLQTVQDACHPRTLDAGQVRCAGAGERRLRRHGAQPLRVVIRPHAIDNFLFVGAGRRACEILGNASLPCHHYAEDRATDVASTYQSPDFIRDF